MAQAEHLPIYKAGYDLCLYLLYLEQGASLRNHPFVERLRENARAVRIKGFSRDDPLGFLER